MERQSGPDNRAGSMFRVPSPPGSGTIGGMSEPPAEHTPNRKERRKKLRKARKEAPRTPSLDQLEAAMPAQRASAPSSRTGVAKSFTGEDAAVLVAATFLALASLRSDDVWTVIPCLFISAGCFAYLFWLRVTSAKIRLALILAVVIVFALFGRRIYGRIVEGKQEDAFNHLTIEMGPIQPGNPMYLLYTIKNGGSSTIKRHQTTCVFNKIMDSENSGFVVAPTGVVGGWKDSPIEGGGDAQTDRCYTEFMGFNGPVVCADVTIKVAYELEIQPDIRKTKSMRFVATHANGPHWYQESPTTPGNYCDGIANTTR